MRKLLERYPETLKHRRNPNHWRSVYALALVERVERSAYAASARKAAALQRQRPKSLRSVAKT